MEFTAIEAAGGNPTGIVQFSNINHRSEYIKIASRLMPQDLRLEQFGFLEGLNSFYMSGGEFSGNGARAAAWLIYKLTNKTSGSFVMSGITNPVKYKIFPKNIVECEFPDLVIKVSPIELKNGYKGILVDMGGIVHFVLDMSIKFVSKEKYYKKIHKEIFQELQLEHLPATGVIWQQQEFKNITVHPIVRVRDANSFFYETSCGSGSLAVLMASGKQSLTVIQPSGKGIYTEKTVGGFILRSEVKEI